MKAWVLLVLSLVFSLIASAVFAEWTVTYLHPTGYTSSWGYGVSDGQQVGYVTVGYHDHASLWTGSAGSWIDLHPAGYNSSIVTSISRGQQAGMAYLSGVNSPHASIWTGSAGSWIDLMPAGCSQSNAWGVSFGQQVGNASGSATGSRTHASLWNGTAASWVDLHPAGFNTSSAYATHNGQQVGYASNSLDHEHAGLWAGTAGSWVDLHPAGGYDNSHAFGVSGGQQGGVAHINGNGHAGIWNGTAASWVDLHPAGASSSGIRAVSYGRQVGSANSHAAIWSGTADSWFDLHSLLGTDYWLSCAYGVEVTDSDIWVAGYAYNSDAKRNDAILWHNVIPEPSSLLILGSGLLALAGMIRIRQGYGGQVVHEGERHPQIRDFVRPYAVSILSIPVSFPSP